MGVHPMLRRSFHSLSGLVLIAAAGCGGEDAENDQLADIRSRGTLRVATDAAFPPASMMNPDGSFEGFDVEVAEAVASKMGVAVEFVTPDWEEVTDGMWGDAWDISVGSMSITRDRERVLHFVRPPYYYTPAYFAATTDSGITTLDGIAGQAVCVGGGTTYETYLSSGASALGYPESSIFVDTPPSGITLVSKPADQDCFDSLAAGDASFQVILTAEPLIDDNVGRGATLVKVDGAVFTEELAIAIDRSHSRDTARLMEELGRSVQELHAEGTLSESSERWFGSDLTERPGGT